MFTLGKNKVEKSNKLLLLKEATFCFLLHSLISPLNFSDCHFGLIKCKLIEKL